MNFCKVKIEDVKAREILDSRGNPTVETKVILSNGSIGVASVPSGASTGSYEAKELRDNDSERLGGKGVLEAVGNVNGIIRDSLIGITPCFTTADAIMCKLDGTDDKSHLGANAILSVSLAVAHASAAYYRMPLYKYLGGVCSFKMPVPMMNVINGGAHADNSLDVQEFMLVPNGFSKFSDAYFACSEIYHRLAGILKKDKKSTAVGDEGGFAPDLNNESEALDYLCAAIDESGYNGKVKIALDVAASEWETGDGYHLPKLKTSMSSDEIIKKFLSLAHEYPIISIEDILGENDSDGWKKATLEADRDLMLVGDDLFVTNCKRLKSGINNGEANAILVKPNQIGTLSETVAVCRLAERYGYKTVLSHRSGETPDTSISDIAVALGANYIKGGAPCRGERVAKYNRLVEIESELGEAAIFG